MEEVRPFACETVLRACGYAMLAIFCIMIALSFQPHAAFRTGGLLSLLLTLVLLEKATEARTKDYRRTEVWLHLPKECRPAAANAQSTISTVMRETYLLFARWTALICVAMWTIALFCWTFSRRCRRRVLATPSLTGRSRWSKGQSASVVLASR